MPRLIGARLAVPLILTTTLILVAIDLGAPSTAKAADGCRVVPGGVVCTFEGRTTTISTSVRRTAPTGTAAQLPPRYPAVSPSGCWYWSRAPAGLASHARMLHVTQHRLSRCGAASAQPARNVVVIDVETTAWRVFRSFPLHDPVFRLSPIIGITNLPSRLHLASTHRFQHSETLPDGRRLDVAAEVDAVVIDWGDGGALERRGLEAVGDPGAVSHTYVLKTCPSDYRTVHLDGPKCHPFHSAYPITVTLRWTASYRVDGDWIPLGSLDRAGTTDHDVDEVLGVLVDADGT